MKYEVSAFFIVEAENESDARQVVLGSVSPGAAVEDWGVESVDEFDDLMDDPSVRPEGPETAEGGLIGQQPY